MPTTMTAGLQLKWHFIVTAGHLVSKSLCVASSADQSRFVQHNLEAGKLKHVAVARKRCGATFQEQLQRLPGHSNEVHAQTFTQNLS